MDHQVRLGSGNNDAVAGLRQTVRVQTVGLHQNVGYTGGFKQHATIRNDYQDLLHVMKSTFLTI